MTTPHPFRHFVAGLAATTPSAPPSPLSLFTHSLNLLFSLLLSLLAPSAHADEQFGDFSYTSDGSAITITGYTGEGGAVTIPGTIAGLPVRTIGEDAFYSNDSFTSVTIPDSVFSIGDGAFFSCELANVTIGNSVTSIGVQAFSYCGNLTSMAIPNSVTSIGNWALSGCGSLLTITVATANTVYSSTGGVLFDKNQTTLIQCPGGKSGSYTIPTGVTAIGDSAFAGCTDLTSVTILNSVTTIGDSAFRYCTGLTSVSIGSGVSFIGSGPFESCYNLSSIEVAADNPDYRSVDGVLFNKAVTTLIQYPGGKSGSYIIPNSVTSIGDSAFEGCWELTSVTIPNSVTSIGDFAFDNCPLTSVSIPASVTSVGWSAFISCNELLTIEVAAGNPDYRSVDGVLFNKNQTTLLQYPGGKMGGYAIPNGVTSIDDHAFFSCYNLSSVIIPNSVTSIGIEAFKYCDGLVSVIIPDSVTSIEEMAFASCTGLTSVTIGNSVTSIGRGAFSDCTELTSVTIPGSVTSIDNYAFAWCESLASATFEGNAPASFGSNVFSEVAADFKVYYYAGRTGFLTPEWNGYPTVMLGTPPAIPTLAEWRKQHFGEGVTNTGTAADNADPDGDGFTNIEEYAAGTNPKGAGSQFQVVSATRTGTTYTLTLDAQPGRRYELQRLAATPGATWQTVATQEPPVTASPLSLTDPAAPADAALYRIKATLP